MTNKQYLTVSFFGSRYPAEFPLNTVYAHIYEIQTYLGFINLISQFQQPPMCCRTTS